MCCEKARKIILANKKTPHYTQIMGEWQTYLQLYSNFEGEEKPYSRFFPPTHFSTFENKKQTAVTEKQRGFHRRQQKKWKLGPLFRVRTKCKPPRRQEVLMTLVSNSSHRALCFCIKNANLRRRAKGFLRGYCHCCSAQLPREPIEMRLDMSIQNFYSGNISFYFIIYLSHNHTDSNRITYNRITFKF